LRPGGTVAHSWILKFWILLCFRFDNFLIWTNFTGR
jgi:hypothetical protein